MEKKDSSREGRGIFVRLPEDVYTKLKLYCLEHRITMRELLIRHAERLKEPSLTKSSEK